MKSTFNYADVMKAIQHLTQQAELLHQDEGQRAVQEARSLITEFNLSAADLGFEPLATPAPRVIHRRRPATVKYKDPQSGITWTGRGKTPRWLKAAQSKGLRIDQFAV